jgi:hypothetical protein
MISFILGVLVTIAIFLICLWAMNPNGFKSLMRAFGIGGELPPTDDEKPKPKSTFGVGGELPKDDDEKPKK